MLPAMGWLWLLSLRGIFLVAVPAVLPSLSSAHHVIRDPFPS
jgi:hypothetical protein